MAEKFMNQQEGLFGSALLKKEATFWGVHLGIIENNNNF